MIETFARLHGVLDLLETMNDGIPIVEEKERRYLKELASAWGYGDYAVERDILDQKFRSWIPTLAAYSATVLLHSIVETQLDAFAEHIGKRRSAELRVKDIAGKGVERSARFLERVLSIDVRADPAWSSLQDLQLLRNIIVHRGGKPGESPEQRQQADKLVRTYPHALELRKIDGLHDQIWMSLNLCRDFAQNVDGFFERAFRASGLPRTATCDSTATAKADSANNAAIVPAAPA